MRRLPLRSPPRVRGHPRVCGEKTLLTTECAGEEGSPPRMRGKDGVNDSAQAVTGITPACAGKSNIATTQPCLPGDHPRVCGEKSFCTGQSVRRRGSPPRVRGKVPAPLCCCFLRGITPACAGKSIRSAPSSVLFGDHPRVCGEKGLVKLVNCLAQGSPPRVRGKVNAFSPPLSKRWITPAYAGKSIVFLSIQVRSKDHPRVCGEKLYDLQFSAYQAGSPPRMRGKAAA